MPQQALIIQHHPVVFRLLRRTRLRARRLLKAIIRAMADEPNPITFAEIRARDIAPRSAHPRPAEKPPDCGNPAVQNGSPPPGRQSVCYNL